MKTVLLTLMLVTGCTRPAPFGNYLRAPQDAQAALAVDAAATLFDRLKGQSLVLPDVSTDPFGRTLVAELRALGLTVLAHGDDKAERGVAVFYVLDRLKDSSLYRVTLLVGEHSLSRAYGRAGDGLKGAGPWTEHRRGIGR